MKKHLLVFTIVCSSFIADAQTKTFTSDVVGRVTQFTSKSDTISFSDYVETRPGISERFVFVNGTQYKFVRIESARAHFEDVLNSSGDKIATIPLTGTDQNTIRFTDGTELKFHSTGKTTWSYTKDTKDAIKAFYYLLDEKKHYAVQWEDSTLTSPVIPAVILEYTLTSKHKYQNKKKTGAIIALVGVSAAIAIMRVALEDDSDL
jgi:viroplasmin and RNaseH domain-containing protein